MRTLPARLSCVPVVSADHPVSNIQTLMLAARKLPSQSALIDAPRVILRLACWNTDGRPPAPSSRNPLKLRCTHIMPLTVLPYGAEPMPRLPRMRVQGGSGVPASLRRPRSAAGGAAASLAAAVAMPPGEALRTYASLDRGALLQAVTTQLEEDVVGMEGALRAARSLDTSRDPTRPQSAWVRRAVARLHAPGGEQRAALDSSVNHSLRF